MKNDLLKLFIKHPSVNTDTRTLRKGDLFFALCGANFNGNLYAAQALEKGAAAVVVDDPAYWVREDSRYVFVEDCLEALQALSVAYRTLFHGPLLGLTGSNGKTTTKELITSVLQTQKRVHATRGNYNNHIGVPLTLLAMPMNTEVAVVEMGTNQPGDIAQLVGFTAPTHGLITNIGKAHLENLGSLEGVRKEKGALFDYLRENDGTAFVNQDDHRVVKAAEGIRQVLTFGTGEADFSGRVLHHDLEGMTIEVRHQGWDFPLSLRSRISGKHNLMNILAAVAVGTAFGISHEHLQEGIFAYLPANNRSQVLKTGRYTLWLDAYNANPSSMQASIENLFEVHPEKTAVVLGDMLEVGTEVEAEHAGIGHLLQRFSPAMVIGIGPHMQAMVAAYKGPKAWFPDVESAAKELASLLDGAEVILLKGSRGMALERLLPVLEGESR